MPEGGVMYYNNSFINADEANLFTPSMLKNIPYCQIPSSASNLNQNFDARTVNNDFMQQNSLTRSAGVSENMNPSFFHTAAGGTPLPSSTASTSISSDTEDSGINIPLTSKRISTPKLAHDVNPKIELINRNLWFDFHKITNEMVVNKLGRKMFPKIEIRISGLDPQGNYFIILRMRTVDNCRYKFQGGAWSPAGHDALPEWSNPVPHHEGPNGTGEFWMRNPLAFDRVKLTNRPKGEGSLIALSSMHKYQPSVELYTVGNKAPICVLAPKELQFIAVTAYQSQAIIDLKILHNPFAKGFREGSARKRSISYSPESKDSSGNSSSSPPAKQLALAGMPQMNAATAALFFPPNLSTSTFPQNFNLGGVSFGQQMPQNCYNFYSNALMNEAAANSALKMAGNGQYYPNPGFRYNHFSSFPNYGQNANAMFSAGQNNAGNSVNNFNGLMGANLDSSVVPNMAAFQSAIAMLATNCSVPSTAPFTQCAVPSVSNSTTPASSTSTSSENSSSAETKTNRSNAESLEAGNGLLPENYLNLFYQKMLNGKDANNSSG